LGAGADCASQLEINLALFAGIKLENISYNAPVQDIRICKYLLISGGNVVMDDPDAIMELEELLEGVEIKGKLLLRLNLPDYIGYSNKNEHQELMAHGHQSSKFGIPTEELEDLLAQISLPISGFHVHVGTQMDHMGSFEHALNSLNEIAENLNKCGHCITEINLGGGLGIPFDANQKFPSLSYWCQSMNLLKKKHFKYGVEPGHALIGNAVALLTSVQTIKKSRGKNWAIVNVGTDQLAKVTLLKWPHRILTENGEELPSGNDAIAGPLCFAGDTLRENIRADHLKKGSPLLITEVGAYTFSLSNKFNGRSAPKWLLLKSNGNLIQTMEQESPCDELQLAKHSWESDEKGSLSERIAINLVDNLSSKYLTQTCEQDHFQYLNVHREHQRKYHFSVSTTSPVDFISMPFVIRIMGDAAIVSLLHSKGFDQKNFAVWGRKLTLDCYDHIKSNETLEFNITLSETIRKNKKYVTVIRFKTACKKCCGSLIVSFDV
jgi:diaminopimelate decarboxylase